MIARPIRRRWEFIAALFVGFLALALPSYAWAQIDLPPAPYAVPPPRIPDSRNPVLLREQEHVKEREQRREESKNVQEQRSEQKREEKAKQELVDPRPMFGFAEINLVYPKILTTGQRKNYTADFATQFNGWMRLNLDKPSNKNQAWIGLRIAPFSGSGIQRDHAGRFARTYFGPGIGIGNIDGREPGNQAPDMGSRSGWLLSTGVAAVSSLTRSDEPQDSGASDFTSNSWAIDAPGVWLEYRYMHVFMGAMSGNIVFGTQLAQGKTFIYTGIGLAGWL